MTYRRQNQIGMAFFVVMAALGGIKVFAADYSEQAALATTVWITMQQTWAYFWARCCGG